MPGGDRTGPMGIGPRTGRAAGYCTGSRMPGFANPGRMGFGGGFGFGRGFGRGGRNRFLAGGRLGGFRSWAPPIYPDYSDYGPANIREDEREFLMTEARNLKTALDNINKRLDKLQASRSDE